MTDLTRPRRSVLYMPGAKERALEKAATLPADALILDLEDAVAPAEKTAARDLVCETVTARPFGLREVIVRVNALDTDWGRDDLAAAARARPDAILLPKVNGPADVEAAAAITGAMPFWAMIETPLGALNSAAIAGHPLIAGLVLGTNDLAKDLGAAFRPDREPLLTALGLTLLAARAHGVACIDGVFNAFKDDAGLRAECEAGRAMGFDGKTLIHPAQLEIANLVFGPSEDEIATARAHVEAYAAARERGEGVAVVDGRIVENLHAEAAARLLARAEAIARLVGA